MEKELINFALQNGFNTIVEEINNIERSMILKIGFLGEFSSGKSTLINALMDKKILPALDKPSTKSITQIVHKKELEEDKFFKMTNDSIEEIDFIDFEDITTGRISGTAVVHTKSSNLLKEGTLIIDTPGVNSIYKS